VIGAVNTNQWDSQTEGTMTGDYLTVSNHYSTGGTSQLFIQLQVEQY